MCRSSSWSSSAFVSAPLRMRSRPDALHSYTFPLTIEDYVHRIGRTGRAGRTGKSITFFTADDKAHAGELQRVLRDAGQEVRSRPQAL